MDWEYGKTYKLKNLSGSSFKGKLIDRSFGLGRCLDGKDHNGRNCHLPLSAIEDKSRGWEFV